MNSRNVVDQSQNSNEDAIRSRLFGMWASVAESWGLHADYVDAAGAPLTEAMLERAAPSRESACVLELACGAGGVGLAAANLAGPTGHVVLSDAVEEMTSKAR